MRQFLVAAVIAVALVALWAAILPLTAEPAPAQTTHAPPALSKALFLCRGPNGIDRTCTAALAQALVLDASSEGDVSHISDRVCHVDRRTLISLDSHD